MFSLWGEGAQRNSPQPFKWCVFKSITSYVTIFTVTLRAPLRGLGCFHSVIRVTAPEESTRRGRKMKKNRRKEAEGCGGGCGGGRIFHMTKFKFKLQLPHSAFFLCFHWHLATGSWHPTGRLLGCDLSDREQTSLGRNFSYRKSSSVTFQT